MKKAAVIILVIILLLLGLFYIRFTQNKKAVDYIEAAGIAEALEAELASKIPGRITWLCCKEGDAVKADSLAIRLDDKELKARVEQGKEALNVAKASVDISRANLENAKLEIDTAKAEVRTAEAEIARMNALTEDAKKNMQRVERLFKEGLISEKDMDAAKTNYDANSAQMDSAKARKMAADARLKNSIANIKIFEAQLSSTKTKVQESQAALSLLETQLKDTEITSPIDGVIVHKAFELGEMANAGASIYTIHDLKNIWARVDIEETDIGKIKLGSKADVFLESMPQKGFIGEVIEIGREAGFATQRDVTRGRSDIKTFRVKVGIKESNGLLKPGMTVKARIYYR
ncbi:MAG: efflux RND transporter periplasmic adaptor subunit [Deltaproteobacteria bacterium]|nr:efflux RND transporter periplasmic adaptor subunit [Deltaproteobacteria bacterium]